MKLCSIFKAFARSVWRGPLSRHSLVCVCASLARVSWQRVLRCGTVPKNCKQYLKKQRGVRSQSGNELGERSVLRAWRTKTKYTRMYRDECEEGYTAQLYMHHPSSPVGVGRCVGSPVNPCLFVLWPQAVLAHAKPVERGMRAQSSPFRRTAVLRPFSKPWNGPRLASGKASEQCGRRPARLPRGMHAVRYS